MEEIVRKATHGLRMRLTEITDRRRKSHVTPLPKIVISIVAMIFCLQ